MPKDLEYFDFTVATLQGTLAQQPTFTSQESSEWVIQRPQRRAYRFSVVPQSWLVGNACFEMVAIPGGSFLMGSSEDEPERSDDESPQHQVTVSPFFMGRYPVNQAQWRLVAAFSEVHKRLEPDPSRVKGDNRPVESVSWYDALEFCNRLSGMTGYNYCLPSEAQWEYACRAGTTTPFHFGETITTEVANYNGNSYNDGPEGDDRGETTPVDHFGIANAFGLSDMHGNVFEWCLDYDNHYDKAPIDDSARLSEDESRLRVLRGGSWVGLPRDCRSASRRNYSPRDYFINNHGFRVVSVAPRTL